jgi:NAD(P)H-hydrate epimerase
LGVAVEAEETVTFGRYKAGLFQGAGVTHCGDIALVGLGIPDAEVLAEVGHAATVIDAALVARDLGVRRPDTHKYRAGSVLALAGSEGKLGAALLVARGVLRSGAGIATIGTFPAAAAALGGRFEEAMTLALDPAHLAASLALAFDRRAAIAVGPGLGLDERAKTLATAAVSGFEGPVVVDADAISCFAGRPEALRGAPGPRVLTPHAGELARLLGVTSETIDGHRFAAAREAAEKTGCTVVLKGPHTIVATGDHVEVCCEGNAALGTAGSGDVLTGITAAMLCSLPAHEAARAAVLLHARAADRWVARTGADRGMLASEIADELPGTIASLLR